MQSPELLLSQLNRALHRVRSTVALLEAPNLDGELVVPLLRRLRLAEVMGDRVVFAIAGSQGAGKTTLLREMYGLDSSIDPWLEPNAGLGEKLPILVVEDDVDAPQGYLQALSVSRVGLTRDPVTPEDFRKATAGGSAEVILPELVVPRRFFEGAHRAWLLLPGYESQSSDNRAWQELMRQAVVGASGCILVTDPTRLASSEQLAIAADVKSDDMGGVQTLVVVSKTEQYAGNPEKLAELRANAVRAFGLKDDSGVVCTGTASESYRDEWGPALVQGLRTLGSSSGELRRNQLARLRKLVGEDVQDLYLQLRAEAEDAIQRVRAGKGSEIEIAAVLDAFDSESDRLRSRFSRRLQGLLDARTKKAREDINQVLITEYENYRARIGNYFTSSTRFQVGLEKKIEDAWKAQGPAIAEFQAAVFESATSKLRSGALLTGSPDPSEGRALVRLGYVDCCGEPISWPVVERQQQNYRVLFATGDATLDAPTETLEEAVTLLPAIALEYARLAGEIPRMVKVDDTEFRPIDIDGRQAAAALSGEVGSAGIVAKTVLGTLATVLAVDLAVDGDIDAGAILSGGEAAGEASGPVVAGGAGLATAAMSNPIVAAAAATIAVGWVVTRGVQRTRINDKSLQNSTMIALNAIADSHLAHFMDQYDVIVGDMRAKLVDALRRRYKLDERLMEHDRIVKSIADLRSARRAILDQIADSSADIDLFGSV